MNKQKIEDLRERLHRVVDTGLAKAYHQYIIDLIDACLEDEGEEDTGPLLDTSLRGWVFVHDEERDEFAVMQATENGVWFWDDGPGYYWSDLQNMSWTVRPLTPADLGIEAYTAEEIDRALDCENVPSTRRLDVLGRLRWNRMDELTDEPEKAKKANTTEPSSQDGWIKHDGSPCPVAGDQLVELRLRNGDTLTDDAQAWLWGHDGVEYDIVAYRVVEEDV
jgi:hypothetical protein